MPRYFAGNGYEMGTVTELPQCTFEALCKEVIEKPVRLKITREQFFALPKKLPIKNGVLPNDQNHAKRVRYITPASFMTSPSHRGYGEAQRANLIALDIDDSTEAQRLLEQGWGSLGDLAFIVWRTASSTPEAPRLRLIASAEGIAVGRYAAAVRTVAEMIGLQKITTESKVIVQPMYLPTVFRDDTESPIVLCQTEGDPIRPGDIMDSPDDPVDSTPQTPDDVEVADLDFLRAPMDNISLEDAKSALDALDPDMPMQQWIEIACGLKHQFGEEGFALWDVWSAKGKKYSDTGDLGYRWRSLKAQPTDRSPVTIRSVFRAAQARGWSNVQLARRIHQETLSWLKNEQRSTEELLDHGAERIAKVGPAITQLERKALMVSLKERLEDAGIPASLPDIRKDVRKFELATAKTTGLPPWARGICYVSGLNVFFRHTVDRQFKPEVLDLMYSTPPMGDEKPMRPREYLIQVADVPVVENLRYSPAMGAKRFFSEDGVPYVNTYRPTFAPPDTERADEAGEIFLAHQAHLIAEPEYRQVMMDFFAYLVQHPGQKVNWCPLIQSTKGAGKTFHAVAMKAILGRKNVSKLAPLDVMNGNFNDWAYGTQLVVMDEIRIVGHNRHAIMDKLKPCISDQDIPLHRKFEGHRTVENVANYLMFTNYHDALAIQDDERRYFVIESPLQTRADVVALGEDYFKRLFTMVEENAGGLRSFFEQWQISSEFQPKGQAPVTKYLSRMAEHSSSPLSAAVQEVLADQPHPLVRQDLVSLQSLRESLAEFHVSDFSDQGLASILRELGWTRNVRVLLEGSRHTLWTKRFHGNPQSAAADRLSIL